MRHERHTSGVIPAPSRRCGRPVARLVRTRYSLLRSPAMFIGYTPDQERLRQELREYFATLMTPERRAALAGGGDYGDGTGYKDVVRQMGAGGWLTLSWPEQYGGRGASMLDQLVFTDEAAIAGAPVPFLTINT